MFNTRGFGGEQGGGGGFLNTSSQFSSPSDGNQQEKKGTRRAQNVVPVTIKQLLNSPEEGLKIGELDVHLVTVVGVIRSVVADSMKVTYLLDDDTGVISVHNWVDADSDEDSPVAVMESNYYRVYGSLRSQAGKRHVTLFKILPLTDLNELTSHILEVTHCTLKSEQMVTAEQTAAQSSNERSSVANSNNTFLSNSMVPMCTDDNMMSHSINGMTQKQRVVYHIIKKNSISDCGVTHEDIMQQLPIKLTMTELKETVTFLSNEGHIYSTIDDEHFKSTDS
uniref:Replication protein A C-terminal domain-containing protein n=1 Tax=Timema douglasi TaxID=61478 RepID=A0A7R8VM21_TIMDO|nr:unnamed protein product [Timema douglasi]